MQNLLVSPNVFLYLPLSSITTYIGFPWLADFDEL